MLLYKQQIQSKERHDRVEYKIASNRDELSQAFQLVYRAYARSGLVGDNPTAMRITPHQLLPSTDVFVAKADSRVVSTVTLIQDAQLGLPMESIYRSEVEQYRSRGKNIAEISSLADAGDRSYHRCIELFRLLVHTALHRKVDVLVLSVHPKHVRFYTCYLAFQIIGSEAAYPAVCNHPAIPLALEFNELDESTMGKMRALFARPFPPERLRSHTLTDADHKYFARFLQLSEPTGPGIRRELVKCQSACQVPTALTSEINALHHHQEVVGSR